MKVWLTRKHAERIDGIDLRAYAVGDTLDLPPDDARILMAEEWAVLERRFQERSRRPARGRRAADRR
jgi:hypothetical protein